MDELKTWISGICAASLLISVMKSLLPDSAVSKTFNLTASLVLIITVISPIKKFNFDTFNLELKQNKDSISEMIQQVTDENIKMTDRIIESELCEYICNKTDLNSDDIKIICENGEIVKVQLKKTDESAINVLKTECGISEERIERW